MADAAESWDAEYRAGRYGGEPPVPFTKVIRSYVTDRMPRDGRLYAGCGRNFVPLASAGLDLEGVDISGEAVSALLVRMPGVRARGDVRLCHIHLVVPARRP